MCDTVGAHCVDYRSCWCFYDFTFEGLKFLEHTSILVYYMFQQLQLLRRKVMKNNLHHFYYTHKAVQLMKDYSVRDIQELHYCCDSIT